MSRRAGRAWIVSASLAVGVTITTASAASPPHDAFADCRQQLIARPDDYDSAYCFYQATLTGGLWDAAPGVLGRLIAERPANFWLPLTLGHIYRGRDAARAEALYRQAADGFQRAGHAEGEVVARVSLRDLLFPLGRSSEAAREVDAVAAIADRSSDATVKARAWTAQAMQLHDAGGDLGQAYRLLKQAERVVFPSGGYRLQRTVLGNLGSVAYRLGRLEDALATFERLDALAAAAGELRLRANAQYNIANTVATKETLLPTPGARQRLVDFNERALATAVASRADDFAARAHRALAELLAAEPASRATALAHAKDCTALAARLRLPHDEAVCAWVEASLAGVGDPARRIAAERRALEATARANSPRTNAWSAGRRMRLAWDTKRRTEAVEDGLAALSTIERLRDLQRGVESSAELFSAWTLDYYWFSGRLLERHVEASRQTRLDDDRNLALAFAIAERLRARTLVEQLGAARAARGDSPARPSSSVSADAGAALTAIPSVQRRLLDPALQSGERMRLLQELDTLERQAQETRRLRTVAAGRAPLIDQGFASLEHVQAALADDEAVLSFQIGLWETFDGQFGGGSWLVLLTRDTRSVFRLPDRAELAALVPVYAGLIARGDGLDASAGVRLYERLLAPALATLPARVTRLVMIPDGVLHHLPFDSLRATREGEPLAARYELVSAPSATLWRHWRLEPPSRHGARALAVADPALSGTLDVEALQRNAALHQGLRIGRLPFARREARALTRHMGDVDVLEGAAASEHALKSRDLGAYGLLHVAAHAVADDARPQRSAVLLVPGGPHEDGLLQAREIEALDLDGRVVVLSACQTAAGLVRSGEGVLSLARAFFAAGAHTVIGSRWPIRDEDAAWLFDAFYRHVAGGASLATALRQAKRDAISNGRPTSSWAGVVLLGGGDLVLAPGGVPRSGVNRPLIVGVVASALLALALGSRVTRVVVRAPRRP